MESEKNLNSKIEKPPVLFHASRSPDIEVFEPRAEKIRDRNEGPQIFATPSRAMASIFLVDSDDSWVKSGVINGTLYIIISDEERFRNSDKGGAIYSLPNTTFKNDPEKGLRELEWTSNRPVRPTGKEIVPSALEDMLKNGVRVYFTDKATFQAIKSSPDHGKSILDSLSPFSY
jgi:hypothetical protein